jgi:predicted Zn-dependent peptidase
VIDAEIAAVIAHPDADHVRSAVARTTGSYLRTMDSFVQRALAMAPLEMFRGQAEMVNEFPKRLAAITPDAVAAAAAAWLQPSGRSVLEVVQKAEA